MEKILITILNLLYKSWISYLGEKKPSFFFECERITHTIYSPEHINFVTFQLRNNFFSFRLNNSTGLKELSCNRFEFDSIENIRQLGLHWERPNNDAFYFGLGCTTVSRIRKNKELKIIFSPIKVPKNIFHTDIILLKSFVSQNGDALPADIALFREKLKRQWTVYLDANNTLKKEFIVCTAE